MWPRYYEYEEAPEFLWMIDANHYQWMRINNGLFYVLHRGRRYAGCFERGRWPRATIMMEM